MNASDSPLSPLLSPRHLAVVGAERPGATRARQIAALARATASTAPVVEAAHPNQIGPEAGPLDLVVVDVPPEDVLEVAAAAADRGARALVVVPPLAGVLLLASEDDPDAVDVPAEEALLALCEERGLLLVGPGAAGVMRQGAGEVVAALATSALPPVGHVAACAQAGAEEALLAAACQAGVGLSAFATASPSGVSAIDLIEAFAADAMTRAIVVHADTLGDPEGLPTRVRAVAARKPVVLVLPGARPRLPLEDADTPAAPALARLDDVVRSLGVHRAASPRDALRLADALARGPTPNGPRVAVVANSAGAAALAAAATRAQGMTLAALPPETSRAIASEVHVHARVDNPVDLRPDASLRHLGVTLDALASAPTVDAILVAWGLPVEASPDDAATWRALVEGRERPTVVASAWGAGAAGSPEEAAAALAALVRAPTLRAHAAAPAVEVSVQAPLAQAVVIGARLTDRTHLQPDELDRILTAYGLPTGRRITVASPHAARRAGAELGYPVALSVATHAVAAAPRQAPHHPAQRPVVLPLTDGDALEAALLRLWDDVCGEDPHAAFTVRPVPPSARTFVAGARLDPRFGPLVHLAHDDPDAPPARAACAPLSQRAAMRLTAPFALGQARARVADVLVRLGQLVVDFPELSLFRLSPLLVAADGTVAVAQAEARVAFRD